MAVTYEPIASVFSTNATTTLSNISSTYTDLVLILNHVCGSGGGGQDIYIRFNSDSGSNYSRTYIYGFNNTPASGRQTNQTSIATASDTTRHMNVMHIMSANSTAVHKTVLDSFGGAGRIIGRQVGLWRSTSAISSISILGPINGSSIEVSVSLYGIKAA